MPKKNPSVPKTPTLGECFKKNLRSYRGAISQGKFAKTLKISVSYMSMLERGVRTPPLERIEKMAKILGVPPLSLLRG